MFKIFEVVLISLTIMSPWCRTAQAEDSYNKLEFLFLQGYHRLGARSWGMGGASVAGVQDVTAVLSNPARLNSLGKLEGHGEIGYRSRIEWLASSQDNSYIKPARPGFIGVNIGLKNRLSFGLAYYTSYGMWLDVGQGIIIVGDGDESETVHIHSKASVRRFACALSCRLHRRLSIGLTLAFHRARCIDHYGDLFEQGTEEYTYSGDGQSFLLGVHVEPGEDFALGATLRPAYSMIGSETFLHTEPDMRFEDDFPTEVKIGCSYRVGSVFKLAFDCKWTFWESIKDDTGARRFKDTLDIFNGAEFHVSSRVSWRCGYCTYADPWIDNRRVIDENQNFLTSGATVRLGDLHLTIALMDSHLLQGEDIETTTMLLGCTYRLRKGGESP